LTLALLVALVAGVLPLPVLFMIAYAVALVVNYPSMDEQKGRLADHAANALAVASVICAAGILTGIMSGTKMIDAMGNSVVALVPTSLGPHMAIVTSVLSIPFTFFLSNDAFYFGVLPILNQAAATYGISAAEMGTRVRDWSAGALAESLGAVDVSTGRPGRGGAWGSPAVHDQMGGADVDRAVGDWIAGRRDSL
jgi:Mg2+/citrate symporter